MIEKDAMKSKIEELRTGREALISRLGQVTLEKQALERRILVVEGQIDALMYVLGEPESDAAPEAAENGPE
jgi:hypothetical protein